MEKIIIIAGATASGKSKVAIEVAKTINGEIISADSMQIYRGMNIGTAKVTTHEMENIPHHMIDIVNADSNFSVNDFYEQSKKIITQIIAKGKIPIICGGTGFYIESLIYPFGVGYMEKSSEVKEKYYNILEERGSQYLHNLLKDIDPIDAEKIHPNNTKRLIRALEIFDLTGKTKSEQSNNQNLCYEIDFNVLNVEREILYNRINLRVKEMFDEGLLKEVENLLSKGLTFNNQSMQAIGYKEFSKFFNNEITFEETQDLIKKNSRHYAKRQITWFKKYTFANWMSPQECLKKYI